MHEMNQFGPEESEARLVSALRHLAQQSSPTASPDVGAGLATAFRRHHRRRRARNAAVVAVAICCLVTLATLLTRSQKLAPTMAEKTPSPVAVPVASATPSAIVSTHVEIAKIARRGSGREPLLGQGIQSQVQQAAAFLPLPSYDPAAVKGELQIIRVEMPLQDLRLVGAPVAADVPNRLVKADFVVGHDGIPYAVRLLQ